QTTLLDRRAKGVDRRQAIARSELDDDLAMPVHLSVRRYEKTAIRLALQPGDRRFDLGGLAGRGYHQIHGKRRGCKRDRPARARLVSTAWSRTSSLASRASSGCLSSRAIRALPTRANPQTSARSATSSVCATCSKAACAWHRAASAS